ncbi:hypothetical protein A2V61_03965 [Candidatus Woesebacteria bacterium RBG_19FT_COMBO_47_8]|uniref:RNase H type-1 domain-containing protein n=1 Tax=Candidatus Woesebacteria bacterium RBG_13_46_13 TaxID=1802479 RepID=A0A1F7X652_9BACT|nr:MAG: hypothetical protein A2Y68_01940 [Candidatus Woesebacteria bacterium RBG_13_46_13]OGM16819.1 MAG: hypothetical protein A2V61_03965 [Candidatus Woesebacteria bacterium RBG_19FT_COMBO_47_8]HJX59345.1 ribonuclease HI family protein [Patescibacteria group bacterium]
MQNYLSIYCDGGARGNPGPAAAAFVVEKSGKVIYKESSFLGKATNNTAEYSAARLALAWLQKQNDIPKQVEVIMDSELVVKQLLGIFKVKNENLRNFYYSVKSIEKNIPTKIIYKSVPRIKNKIADFLVNETLDENS